MSDYLSRLVKRSHNSAEVIKPRLASLFEPPVQDGVSFRGKYGSDHLNVDPISNEREHNDLLPTRPSSDPASGNGELKELHQQNHKPHVRSGAFQQTEQPEPQHIPDPQRIDRIHSILNHDIGRFSDQLAPQPSKQDHTVQLSSDNKTYKPYKTHDIPHRTSDMKSQPYAHDPDIRSNEISPSAPVLPQSNQEPPEQVKALSSINNMNHDMPHRSGTKRSRMSAQSQEIQPFVIKPAVSHEKMQITKPAEPIEPPVIKVTIGRIEVRAVTPPAPIPPQQVKQSSPLLSLDEYLRLRDGGEL
jgi:hypothetical protein